MLNHLLRVIVFSCLMLHYLTDACLLNIPQKHSQLNPKLEIEFKNLRRLLEEPKIARKPLPTSDETSEEASKFQNLTSTLTQILTLTLKLNPNPYPDNFRI
jgi:hypothetical protein